MKDRKRSKISRRQFIRRAGAGVALFHIVPSSVLARPGRISPNEKLNVAGIGFGSQGGRDVDAVADLGENIVALCDVDHNYAAAEFAKYPDAERFVDFRHMFDRMDKQIDAVVIGVPDHNHAIIAMEAMRRGKHVYCEKPLAHNVRDVRKLMAAAHKYNVVTQLGNQGHSFDTIRQLCEWVWAGAIGPVHTVHAGCDAFKNVYCQIPNLGKVDQHYDVPPGLDYDLWVGPAEFRPYTPLWVPWNWRGWLQFGSGCIGDWFCHVLDPSFWALSLDAPTSVVAEVKDYDPVTDGLTYPPASKITYEFPAKGNRGPVEVVWYDGNFTIPRPADFSKDDQVNGVGAIMFGEKGMIVHGSHGAGGCYITPESLLNQYSGKNAPAKIIPRVKEHHWDWVEAIRKGRKAGSNFDYGGPLTQSALLGVIAIRFAGEKLKWDDAKMRFTNNDAANALIHPPYRKGWKI